MKDFLKELEHRILIHDGSKGYMLQKLGLKGGECGELWNLTNREAVMEVYRSYVDAGADVIQTNTFTGNRIHLHKFSLNDKVVEINYWGARLAKEVAGDERFVCASIGPTGLLFEPSGELTFNRAHAIFCEQVRAVEDGGADIINFETFTDLAEMRVALLAAKETSSLPVICSLAFENGGRTLMGTEPSIAVAVLKALGADMVGTNCSFGPEQLLGIAKEMYEAGGGYLSMKPNAGLPQVIDGVVQYEKSAEYFAALSAQFVQYGARLIGGCCGTTPEYIRALRERISGLEPVAPKARKTGILTSAVKTVDISRLDSDNIGMLDASTDMELLEALNKNDLSYVEDMALDLASEGHEAIYVNIGSAKGDSSLLSQVVDRMQWYIREPLIIETFDANALEKALRLYRGIAGVAVNEASDTGIREALAAIAHRYGSEVLSDGIAALRQHG